jgi:hypothetical protein
LRLGLITDIHYDKLDAGEQRKSGSASKEQKKAIPRLCDDCSAVLPQSARVHSQESSAVIARPLTVRSASTNDPLLLRGVDGRSVVARRYRDVAIALPTTSAAKTS